MAVVTFLLIDNVSFPPGTDVSVYEASEWSPESNPNPPGEPVTTFTMDADGVTIGGLDPETPYYAYGENGRIVGFTTRAAEDLVDEDEVSFDLPFINVQDFGAIGDGVTDDTAAIQEAIDFALDEANGGTLFFPAPSLRYLVTDTLNLEPRGSAHYFTLNIYSEGGVNAIGWGGGSDAAVFHAYGWKHSSIENVQVGLVVDDLENVVIWELDVDEDRESTGFLHFKRCAVWTASTHNDIVGWRIGNSSVADDGTESSFNVFDSCVVDFADKDNGGIAFDNSVHAFGNSVAHTWVACGASNCDTFLKTNGWEDVETLEGCGISFCNEFLDARTAGGGNYVINGGRIETAGRFYAAPDNTSPLATRLTSLTANSCLIARATGGTGDTITTFGPSSIVLNSCKFMDRDYTGKFNLTNWYPNPQSSFVMNGGAIELANADDSPFVIPEEPWRVELNNVNRISSAIPVGLVYPPVLDRSVSILEFGGVGDGTTDNADAFAAAFAALPDGGELVFPPGEYVTSEAVTPPAYTRLRGLGAQSWDANVAPVMISCMAGFTGGLLHGEAGVGSVTVENLAFNGRLSSEDGAIGIRVEDATGWVFRDVHVSAFRAQGFKGEAGLDLVVENMWLVGCCLKRTGLAGLRGVFEHNGADSILHGIRATASISTDWGEGVGGPGSGYICGIYLKSGAANAHMSSCFGHLSQTGVVIQTSRCHIVGCRSDINEAGGWVIEGSYNRVVGCSSYRDGQGANSSYDAMTIHSGGGNAIIGFQAESLSGDAEKIRHVIVDASASDPNHIVAPKGILHQGSLVYHGGASVPIVVGAPGRMPGVGSGSSIAAPVDTDFFAVSGSSTINTITGGYTGREITIKFTGGTPTVADGAGNIKLSAAFAANEDDTLSLVYDGSNWLETSRTAN